MSSMSPWYRRVVPILLLGFGSLTPATSGQTREVDTIKLQNGNVLEGVILSDGQDTLVVRIGPGQEVELPKHVIASYVRVSDPKQVDREQPAAPWATRNEWFRVRDADGRVVGKLHLLVRPGDAGTIRIEEQWNFVGEDTRTLILRLETVDAKLRPLSFLYREAVSRKVDGNLITERVTSGEVREGKLHLKDKRTDGSSERNIPFPDGNYFPLLVEEMLRRGEAKGARSFHASIYDPMDAVFELRRYDLAEGVAAPDTLARKSKVRPDRARLLRWSSGGREQREWIGADGKILLIECNGVHLVAEPVAEAMAQRLDGLMHEMAAASWRPFAGYHVWLPSATWAFGAEPVKGKVLSLEAGLPDVDVVLYFREAAEDELLLQAAGEEFLNRWQLDQPWFEESSQELEEIGGRPFLRIDGGGKSAEGRLRRGRIYVGEAPNGYVVLSAEAPAKAWPQLTPGLEGLLEGLRVPGTEASAPGR